MPSAETPLRSAAPPVHGHADEARAALPALTLLSSGLACRVGTAAALTALLWAVVLWALA